MTKKVIYFVLSFLLGCLLLVINAFAFIGWVGVGHQTQQMPGRELTAPLGLYPLVWPLLFPLSLSRTALLRRTVRYTVLSQVILATVSLLSTGGVSRINARMQGGYDATDPVVLTVLSYLFATSFLLLASTVPRRTVGSHGGGASS